MLPANQHPSPDHTPKPALSPTALAQGPHPLARAGPASSAPRCALPTPLNSAVPRALAPGAPASPARCPPVPSLSLPCAPDPASFSSPVPSRCRPLTPPRPGAPEALAGGRCLWRAPKVGVRTSSRSESARGHGRVGLAGAGTGAGCCASPRSGEPVRVRGRESACPPSSSLRVSAVFSLLRSLTVCLRVCLVGEGRG